QCQVGAATGNFATGRTPARKYRRCCRTGTLAHCSTTVGHHLGRGATQRRANIRVPRWPNHRRCPRTRPERDRAEGRSRQLGAGTPLPMDAYADRREGEALTHRQTRLIVLGVLLPTFMGALAQTILATALPTIGRAFGDVHNLPWLITAYLLASTAIIPLYGKIADIHGRRFTLRIAILTYMAGSLVCALAQHAGPDSRSR